MKFFLSSLLALSAIGFAFAEENTTSTDETCNNGVNVIKKHVGEKYTQEIVGSSHLLPIERTLTLGP